MILEVGHHPEAGVDSVSQNRPLRRKMEGLKMKMNRPKNRQGVRPLNPSWLSPSHQPQLPPQPRPLYHGHFSDHQRWTLHFLFDSTTGDMIPDVMALGKHARRTTKTRVLKHVTNGIVDKMYDSVIGTQASRVQTAE